MGLLRNLNAVLISVGVRTHVTGKGVASKVQKCRARRRGVTIAVPEVPEMPEMPEMNAPKDNNRITELMLAASRGELSRVEALLRGDADVNARDVFGQTALIYAASAGHQSVAEELIDGGADLDARNRNNKSAFDLAEARGHAALAALLRNARLFIAARDGDVARLEALLDSGVDPNALLRDEWTSLMIAALNNRPQVVAALLRRGAYPDAQNATGWTALMIAERKGHAEVARLLGQGRAEKPLPALIKQSAAADGAARADDIDLSEFPDHIKD
jgi:ankyrin repeat protein